MGRNSTTPQKNQDREITRGQNKTKNPTCTVAQTKDYNSLQGSNYLNDTTIIDTIRKIVQCKPDTSYLISYFISHITDPNNRNTPTVQSVRNKLQTHREIRHWYVPHCAHSHWYYLKIDTQEQRIIQSDPLNTHGQHYGRHLVELLNIVYPGVWLLEYKNMKLQHNGYDCGPYVLNEIIHEVNGVETEGIPSRNQIRRFLTENINIISFNSVEAHEQEHKTKNKSTPTCVIEQNPTKPTETHRGNKHSHEDHVGKPNEI